jgi:hypothetical protein
MATEWLGRLALCQRPSHIHEGLALRGRELNAYATWTVVEGTHALPGHDPGTSRVETSSSDLSPANGHSDI